MNLSRLTLFGGIILLLFFLPLIFNPGVFLGFEIPKTRFLYLSVIFMLAGFSVGLLKAKGQKRWPAKEEGGTLISTLAVIFFLAIVLTSLIGKNWGQSFWGAPWRKQGIFTLGFYLLFFFITSEAFSLGLKRKLVSKTIALSSFSCSLYVLGQAFYYFYLKDSAVIVYSNDRLVGTFSNPNLMAGYLALAFPFSLYLLTTSTHWFQKVLYYFNLSLIFTASLFSFSKSGILSFIAAFLLFVFFNLPKAKAKLAAFLILFCCLFITKFALLESNSGFLRDSRYESRLSIWQNALEAIVKRPLTGYGWENFEYAMDEVVTEDDYSIYNYYIDRAHNELLEIATATGLPGLIIFLIFITASFHQAFLKYKKAEGVDKKWQQALISSLTIFLVFTQFSFFLTTGYVYFWFTLAAINSS